MATRQKILIGVLIAVALYGASTLLFQGGGPPPGPQRTSEQEQARFKQTVDNVVKEIGKNQMSKADLYRVSSAVRDWGAAPFYQSTRAFSFVGVGKDEFTRSFEGTELSYSGYLEYGPARIAVINGIEYAVGDELASGDLRVAEIGKDSVTLERAADKADKADKTGKAVRIKIPLAEDKLEKIDLKWTGRR